MIFYESAHPVRECSMRLPFTFSLSIPYISFSLSLSYISLPLYISPSTFLSLSLLSFSLAYLMDVFVLVTNTFGSDLISCYTLKLYQNWFSTSRPKNIYFSCQIKWLNIFLVSTFSYRQINLTWKVNLFKPYTWKILFNSLRNCKET